MRFQTPRPPPVSSRASLVHSRSSPDPAGPSQGHVLAALPFSCAYCVQQVPMTWPAHGRRSAGPRAGFVTVIGAPAAPEHLPRPKALVVGPSKPGFVLPSGRPGRGSRPPSARPRPASRQRRLRPPPAMAGTRASTCPQVRRRGLVAADPGHFLRPGRPRFPSVLTRAPPPHDGRLRTGVHDQGLRLVGDLDFHAGRCRLRVERRTRFRRLRSSASGISPPSSLPTRAGRKASRAGPGSSGAVFPDRGRTIRRPRPASKGQRGRLRSWRVDSWPFSKRRLASDRRA